MDDSKILEMKHKAPELLEHTHYIMEAGDYITSLLTYKIYVPIAV